MQRRAGGRSIHVLACLLSALRTAAALLARRQGKDEPLADPVLPSAARRALVVSSLGPDSRYGCGVREFVFVADLRECGYDVDLLTERGGDGRRQGPTHEAFGWTTRTPAEVFRTTRWFGRDDPVELEAYDAIYFFGWFWEYHNERAVPMDLLPRLQAFRNRTTLMLDDVPDVRCMMEREAYPASYCRSAVPGLVAQWMQAAHQVFTLTDTDAALVEGLLRLPGVPAPDGPVRAWPLRLGHLVRLQQEQAENGDKLQNRTFLTMVANDHAANKEFTERLFSTGAVNRWCERAATVMFVGTIGSFVNGIRPQYPGLPDDCVVSAGVQSDRVLAQHIMPRTLAVINPFWRDLRSGVSVKSFEALAAGVPFVTSVFGLRGLEDCGPLDLALGAKQADDVEEYVDYVERLVLRAPMYSLLTAKVQRLRSACAAQQESAFPSGRCAPA